MSNIVFGVPNTRTKKEEKYPGLAVVTLKATQKGHAKKFEFNTQSSDDMMFHDDSKVSVSFIDGEIFLVNTTECDDIVEKYKLTKGTPKSFSNSKVYSHAVKMLDLNESIDNEFVISVMEDADFEGNSLFKMTKIDLSTESEEMNDTADEQESSLAENESNEEMEAIPEPQMDGIDSDSPAA